MQTDSSCPGKRRIKLSSQRRAARGTTTSLLALSGAARGTTASLLSQGCSARGLATSLLSQRRSARGAATSLLSQGCSARGLATSLLSQRRSARGAATSLLSQGCSARGLATSLLSHRRSARTQAHPTKSATIWQTSPDSVNDAVRLISRPFRPARRKGGRVGRVRDGCLLLDVCAFSLANRPRPRKVRLPALPTVVYANVVVTG